MNIALVDDEQRYLDILKDNLTVSLAEFGLEAENIACFTDAQLFLDSMAADKYDIIILDIYMHETNGIDVARRIRDTDENVVLAFCTSSNEYASQSYEVDAQYYLQKPISKDKIAGMLKRFNLAKIARNRSIRLPDGFRVPLRHIVYTEYINHSVQFCIKGQAPHTIRTSQGEVEKLLLGHRGFCVINKGCIVNFAQVRSLEANAFLMLSGQMLPIARRRYKDIETAYTKYLFDKMDQEELD